MGFRILRLFFGFLSFTSLLCTPSQRKECIIYFVFAFFSLPFRRRGSNDPGETDMDDEAGEVD